MAHHVLVLLNLWLSGANAAVSLRAFLDGRWRGGAFYGAVALLGMTPSFL